MSRRWRDHDRTSLITSDYRCIAGRHGRRCRPAFDERCSKAMQGAPGIVVVRLTRRSRAARRTWANSDAGRCATYKRLSFSRSTSFPKSDYFMSMPSGQ